MNPTTHLTHADRYSRQTLSGWRQDVLAGARMLVVGAGALGNEVLKNLALSGIGLVDVMDFDVVESSNLSRCILFRDEDLHCMKARVVPKRLREISPEIETRALPLDVCVDVGAGLLRGYDMVLGCMDNIEARLALGRLCRDAGVVYLDGGMDAAGGQVSLFHPYDGACFECGMTARMWERVAQRQSCLRMGTGEEEMDSMPMAATAMMASSIGALQAQEAVRWLLRETGKTHAPLQPGQKVCLQTAPYGMFVVSASVSSQCETHQRIAVTHCFAGSPVEVTVAQLLDAFAADALSLPWDVVTCMECLDCCVEECLLPLHQITRKQMHCPRCGRVRSPEMQSSIAREDALAGHTLMELGVPQLSVLDLSRTTMTGESERIRVELV
ncbi:ThiF family adenylyltransferase [Terriglobus sp. RCC_193]|uniref:ThiF family adenylyltransferase n=1 Tax=Terriglobus sp. RCC_193 TaxID=3239218 RepID=UPI0035256DFD